jgi:hypothetical protein
MGGRVGGSTVLPARWDRWLTIVWPLFDQFLTSGTTVLAARWARMGRLGGRVADPRVASSDSG